MITARAQRNNPPTTTQTKNYKSPTGNPESTTPIKKLRKPDVKQNNQTRELNKGFSLTPPKQKTAKAQQGASKAQLRHKNYNYASPTRNKKNQPREPNKMVNYHLATTAPTKNCESPPGNLESPTPTRNNGF
jgi:hypothetical protein